MIPKSGYRFSDKIMLKQAARFAGAAQRNEEGENMTSLTRRSVLMTGAAVFALGGSNLESYAQQPKKGGTLNFAISAETPHYDNHGSDTFATLHFAAPFYNTLLRFNLSKFPEIESDLAASHQVAPDL